MYEVPWDFSTGSQRRPSTKKTDQHPSAMWWNNDGVAGRRPGATRWGSAAAANSAVEGAVEVAAKTTAPVRRRLRPEDRHWQRRPARAERLRRPPWVRPWDWSGASQQSPRDDPVRRWRWACGVGPLVTWRVLGRGRLRSDRRDSAAWSWRSECAA